MYKSTKFKFDGKLSVDIELLIFALLLMPLNWIIESVKWQALLKEIERISLKDALRGILIGITFGMATPNRVGEYVGRSIILKKNNRIKGSLATMLGSWSQVLVTLILGQIGWIILFDNIHIFSNLAHKPILVFGLIGLMILMLLIFYNLTWLKKLLVWLSINQRYVDEIKFLIRFSNIELTQVLLLSFSRYIIFTTQYIIVCLQFS